MDEIGCLSLYKNLTEEQYKLFITLLGLEGNEVIKIIDSISENPKLTLQLMDVLAGERFMFPDRKRVFKVLEKVNIYTYVKSRGFSDEAYLSMAKETGKRAAQLKNMVEVIERNIQGKDI